MHLLSRPVNGHSYNGRGRRLNGRSYNGHALVRSRDGYTAIGEVTSAAYTIVGDVAKPANFTVLEQFKELQRQLNRVAKVKGLRAIGIDGDIGPGTIALTQGVQNAAKADLTAGKLADTRAATGVALIRSSTADGIAGGVPAITEHIKGYASQLGASTSVSSPRPAQPPAIYVPSTGLSVPQPMSASALDALKNLSTVEQLGIVGVGVGALIVLGKKKRRRK